GQADEHLVGTYRVQQGELVVEHYRDLHACLLRLLMNCPSAAAGCAESAPVLCRARTERTGEGPPHGLRGSVPASSGGFLDAIGGVLEPAPRRLEPDAVDVTAWRHADLGGERASELAR